MIESHLAIVYSDVRRHSRRVTLPFLATLTARNVMFSPPPSVLDIFVLWHPLDSVGEHIFKRLLKHYRSDSFSGLASGVIDVYSRSASYNDDPNQPPLDIKFNASKFTVVIPVIGPALRDAYIDDENWRKYLTDTLGAATGDLSFAVIPLPLAGIDLSFFTSDTLGNLQDYQHLNPYSDHLSTEIGRIRKNEINKLSVGCLERELNQTIIEKALSFDSVRPSLRIFISYARKDNTTISDVSGNISLHKEASEILQKIGIAKFLDISDLKPLHNWKSSIDHAVISNSHYVSALLVIKTDNYAASPNTQHEVLLAKQNEVPIVALSALTQREYRGSFLLDNIPTIQYQRNQSEVSIVLAINRLIDEVLKFVLWHESMSNLAKRSFDWYSATTPELVTLNTNIMNLVRSGQLNRDSFWIIHPDPIVQEPEREAIRQACAIAGISDESLHIRTPRTVIIRGENSSERSIQTSDVEQNELLSPDTIVGLSMARSNNLANLGLHDFHLERVVAEISQLVSVCGGASLYGGMIGTHSPDLSNSMMDAVSSYFRNPSATVGDNRTCSTRRYFYLWVPLHKIYERWNMRSVLLWDLREAHEKFGDAGQIRIVDWNSNIYSPNCVPSPEHDYTALASSSELFTGFRKALVDKSTVRLALGGKIHPKNEVSRPDEGYSGSIPGIVEETLLSLRAHKHVYISAGYGGAASAIAAYLDIPGAEHGKVALAPLLKNPACVEALQEIHALYDVDNNHLSCDDLVTFTSSYRPTELATLLVKGLANDCR